MAISPDNHLTKTCKRIFDECFNILEAKNHDYAGANASPYKNFLDDELQSWAEDSIDAVELGIRIRLRDKWTRLNTLFLSGNDPAVLDEKLEDTMKDMINYLAIWMAYRDFRQQDIDDILGNGDIEHSKWWTEDK